MLNYKLELNCVIWDSFCESTHKYWITYIIIIVSLIIKSIIIIITCLDYITKFNKFW